MRKQKPDATHKPLVVLDFDGVVHSYSSGWRGPWLIPDPPVPGALRFIVEALPHCRLAIFSSRGRYPGGRLAMRRWLLQQYLRLGDSPPGWWQKRVYETAVSDRMADESRWTARSIVSQIEWPILKPPAYVLIDDRAITFMGEFPAMDALMRFKPWNRQ